MNRGYLWSAVILFLLAVSGLGPVTASSGFPVANHLVALEWTGSTFISSYRDGTTALLNVSLDGSRIEPFAPSFSGQAEVYVALSPGKAGFPPGYLYLCTGGSIYSVTQQGKDLALLANVTSSVIEYINFDYSGQWGYDLLAVDGDGGVWTVNSTGSATKVFSLGSNLMPEGITVAPSNFGAYGGDLIVSMENNHEVVAISKGTIPQNTTLATFPGQAPERVLVIPSPPEDLYVAKYDQGAVVRFEAGNFSEYAGSILVVTEGENGQTGSLNIMTAGGSNVTVKQVFADPDSPHFEGASFVPVTTSGSTSGNGPVSALDLQTASVVVILAGAAVIAALAVRSARKPHPTQGGG